MTSQCLRTSVIFILFCLFCNEVISKFNVVVWVVISDIPEFMYQCYINIPFS